MFAIQWCEKNESILTDFGGGFSVNLDSGRLDLIVGHQTLAAILSWCYCLCIVLQLFLVNEEETDAWLSKSQR